MLLRPRNRDGVLPLTQGGRSNSGLPSGNRNPQKPFTPFQDMLKDLSLAMYPQKMRDKVAADQAYQKAMVAEGEIPLGIGLFGDRDYATEMLGAGVIKNVGKSLANTLGSAYRSRLMPAIEGMPQEKMAAAQAQGHFQKFPGGVGSDELDFTGVQGLLDQGQPVTKTGLLDMARANPLEINDVVKIPSKDGQFGQEIYDLNTEMMAAEARGDWVSAEKIQDKLYAIDEATENGTKFGEWVLPGGDDYQEMLLTMPNKSLPTELRGGAFAKTHGYDPDLILKRGTTENAHWTEAIKKAGADNESRNFASSHYDEPNILAHARYNTRNIDGDKTMFVEEIQSDWHQAGRDRGYKKTPNTPEMEAYDEHIALMDSYQPKLRANREAHAAGVPSDQMPYPGAGEEVSRLNDIRSEMLNKIGAGGVPDAPYKATDKWSGLAFNRMIKEAVDSGHDRIAWTPGQVQAERYDLSKSVDEVMYSKQDDGSYYMEVTDAQGNELLPSPNYKQDELAGAIGKELAEKITSGQGSDLGGMMSLAGNDLQVGGEGMKQFYDKMLTKTAGKIAKKHGSKIEVSGVGTDAIIPVENGSGRFTIRSGDGPTIGAFETRQAAQDYMKENASRFKGSQDVWSMKITPEMRKHFAKGVALSGAGAAALPGLLPTPEQNK